jgi:drug/metabolite transporter (DMT)-like permease
MVNHSFFIIGINIMYSFIFNYHFLLNQVNNNTLGIILFILSVCGSTSMQAISKHMGTLYTLPILLFTRYAGHLIGAIALAFYQGWLSGKGAIILLRTSRPWFHLIRSATMAATTVCVFIKTQYLPIALGTALTLAAAPIFSIIVGYLFKERLTSLKWYVFSIVISGMGCYFLIPTHTILSTALLGITFSLLGSFFEALLQRQYRTAAIENEHSTTSLVYSVLVGTLLSSIYLIYTGIPHINIADGWLFILLALSGMLPSWLQIHAGKYASPTVMAPWRTMQVPYGLGMDILVLGQFPSLIQYVAVVLMATGSIVSLKAKPV